MELPFNYFPYLDWFMDTPARLVIWAAFGVPPFFFLFALLGKFFKNGSIAKHINIVLLVSISFTWIAGFVLMFAFLFTGVPGIKMYFIWLLILISSFIFTSMNFNLIFKNYDETIQKVKNKKK